MTTSPRPLRDPAGTSVPSPDHAQPSVDDALVARNRAAWIVGDFERIAAAYRSDAEDFIDRLHVRRGEEILDVACGTGNLAIPAARAGARVTGVDIAPHLLATARSKAAREGLDIRFDEGNAEWMPYADGSFDTVMTMFGAMFAPRPDRVASELLRVVRPGGRVVMANWTRESFVGLMLRAHTALVPPPSNVPSPILWGDESAVRERLAGARQVDIVRRSVTLRFPMMPKEVVRLFHDSYGPTIRTLEALDAAGRQQLFENLVDLWSAHNAETDGTTAVESEYLEVVAER